MKENLSEKKLLIVSLIGVFLVLCSFLLIPKIEKYFLSVLKKKNYALVVLRPDYYEQFKPLRHWGVKNIDIRAQAGVSLLIDKNKDKKVLWSKNSKKIMPIASLTKLMTVCIALENYDIEEKTTISLKASQQEGDSNFFKQGETFYIKDLIYSCLIESSNKASQALSEVKGESKFVSLMNLKAQSLGLSNTQFFNPTGLDPDFPQRIPNYSTAEDLATLANYLINKPIIQTISTTKEINISQDSGVFHHQAKTTNQLLENPQEFKILIGKTGSTPLAGRCLLIASENSNSNYPLISVVLNSPDPFTDMQEMINWTYKAYQW